MHQLANAREWMIQEGVTKPSDEDVDWGGLLAVCKGDAPSLQ